MAVRVLIVEDHALVREGTRRILEQSGGIEVVGEARDGEEALQEARQLKPDVILMDISMPKLGGIEATRRIKEAWPQVAVLALTAYDDDVYIFAALEAGAAGYLLKTVRSDDLAAAILAVHAGESVLSPAVAAKVVARYNTNPTAAPTTNSLSPREREVLVLAAKGLPNKAIAAELHLSSRTIQMHLARIFQKLDVASRTEAVVVGLKRGWIPMREGA